MFALEAVSIEHPTIPESIKAVTKTWRINWKGLLVIATTYKIGDFNLNTQCHWFD